MLTRCLAHCTEVRPRSWNPTSIRQSSVEDEWRLPDKIDLLSLQNKYFGVFTSGKLIAQSGTVENCTGTEKNQFSIICTVPPWAPIWSRCTSTVRRVESAEPAMRYRNRQKALGISRSNGLIPRFSISLVGQRNTIILRNEKFGRVWKVTLSEMKW